LPCRAAIIETITDNSQPLQIGITIELFQKPGSLIDDKIRKALQTIGTYQILFGFDLTIKKQPRAIIRSFIKWLLSPVSVRGVQIESVMESTITENTKINIAWTQLGAFPKIVPCFIFLKMMFLRSKFVNASEPQNDFGHVC
jgi:hypothetical protein